MKSNKSSNSQISGVYPEMEFSISSEKVDDFDMIDIVKKDQVLMENPSKKRKKKTKKIKKRVLPEEVIRAKKQNKLLSPMIMKSRKNKVDIKKVELVKMTELKIEPTVKPDKPIHPVKPDRSVSIIDLSDDLVKEISNIEKEVEEKKSKSCLPYFDCKCNIM